MKEEAKLQNDQSCSGAQTAKRTQQTQHPEVTEMMDLWVLKAMSNNVLLTGKVLCQQWSRFMDLVGIPGDDCLKLSNGWLAQYKVRKGLKEFKCHGEAASVGLETAKAEQQ